MRYSIIEEPITKSFFKMNKKEAKLYFEWFVQQIPQRIIILECAVQTSERGFSEWKADFTSDSLKSLGEWFFNQVQTRSTNLQEKEAALAAANAALPTEHLSAFAVPEITLTDTSISLYMDIGMYFGEILKKKSSNVDWVIYPKSKSWAYYQQPVLNNFGLVEFCNPIELMGVVATKFAKKKYLPQEIFRLYQVWSGKILTENQSES